MEPLIAIAAALAVGLAGIGAGYAEACVGSAAVGAIAEDEKKFSKVLIMTVIPETIAVFGFIVAVIILML